MAAPHWYLTLLGLLGAYALLVWLPRRLVATWSTRLDTREMPAESFTGGGTWFPMWWPLMATDPFVQLDVLSWGFGIRSSIRLMAWYVPTVDLAWNEIGFTRESLGAGVRLSPASRPTHSVTFTGGGSAQVRLIQILRDHGVPMDGS